MTVLPAGGAATVEPATSGTPVDVASGDGCIAGILFADVVGFSRLPGDLEIIAFFREFLGRVATVGALRPEDAPLVQNTWGDGLYTIFPSVRAAGVYALALARMVATTDWSAVGLPADLNIRIALHAGPLFAFVDPVTGQRTWSGKQVARAARMEPVTPPGSVYASREFAALAAADGVADFRCEPVGRVRLDKKEGERPLFVLRPTPLPAADAAPARRTRGRPAPAGRARGRPRGKTSPSEGQ